jgi:GTP-binding protein
LKVVNAAFITSAAASGNGIPRDGLAQVAMAGRSNVGKSSLINALARRAIARTSAAPGKTRLANVYRLAIEGAGPGRLDLYLVDLPGYGYARGGSKAAVELRAVAETYFSVARSVARSFSCASPDAEDASDARLKPRATLLLVDARHPGLDSDRRAAEWLAQLGLTYHVVATKIDKLTRAERTRNLKAIGDTFGTAVLPVSAASGEGLDALWRMIVRIVRDAGRGE